MKPFTKEQFDANEALIKAIAMFTIGKITNKEYVEIHNKACDLLVNDSEPVMAPYCKADLPAYDGKPVYTYNPETHMLVPRVWSEEEKQAVRIAMYELFNNSDLIPSDAYPIAITKVFGGEK